MDLIPNSIVDFAVRCLGRHVKVCMVWQLGVEHDDHLLFDGMG